MSEVPLTIQKTCRVPVPIATCFKLFLTLKPHEYIHSDKLIAPIVSVEMLSGEAFDHVGARQKITFKDGAVIEEELLAVEPNRQFLYRGVGFSQPVVNFIDHAKGSFEFEKLGDETIITWRYVFHLKPKFSGFLPKMLFKTSVMDLVWSRMMSKTLTNLTQILTLRAIQFKA
ncbi:MULTISPECIES: SRPBCC family protein [Limnobacter]|uniref:SRPBCC family protein n=1 Tax=Limnobacter litoralis TaxID=481366 RepID=A0ABQ5YU14_9BURK|nr:MULTISPECIES: SRPBCC family protein [Limnobacter]GLR26895.1 hypothetical protein GCM10007875_19850 [Limnobacter litoralis]HEX5485312.1 SRPBCC family protein [Limnobacter sp.]